MSTLIKKFNSNAVLYDAFGLDSSYRSIYYNKRYIYFLTGETTAKTLIFDTYTEAISTVIPKISPTDLPSNIYSIVEKDNELYGFNGYNAKVFNGDNVLYIVNNNQLVEESFDRFLKRTLLSSVSEIKDFVIDGDNNYYVIHGPISANKITKFDKYRITQGSITINTNTLTANQLLSANQNDNVVLLKMDFVNEYIGTKKLFYPIVLGCLSASNELFLAKFDEKFTTLTNCKYIGLTANPNNSVNSGRSIRYNLTNYDYLRREYPNDNQLTFVLILRNIYNNNEKSVIEVPIDTTYFVNENHHFAIKMDGINGIIDIFVDGVKYKQIQIDAGKYIFQEILDESISFGSTYFFNNITLNDHLGKPTAYLTQDATLKQFRIYNKALTDTEIRFNLYNGIELDDLIVSLPADERNEIETIETQLRMAIPGFKSNNINLIIKNISNLDDNRKAGLKEMLMERLDKVLPVTTKIKNIEFR